MTMIKTATTWLFHFAYRLLRAAASLDELREAGHIAHLEAGIEAMERRRRPFDVAA